MYILPTMRTFFSYICPQTGVSKWKRPLTFMNNINKCVSETLVSRQWFDKKKTEATLWFCKWMTGFQNKDIIDGECLHSDLSPFRSPVPDFSSIACLNIFLVWLLPPPQQQREAGSLFGAVTHTFIYLSIFFFTIGLHCTLYAPLDLFYQCHCMNPALQCDLRDTWMH